MLCPHLDGGPPRPTAAFVLELMPWNGVCTHPLHPDELSCGPLTPLPGRFTGLVHLLSATSPCVPSSQHPQLDARSVPERLCCFPAMRSWLLQVSPACTRV